MTDSRLEKEYKSIFYKGQITRLIVQSILGLGLLAGGVALLALKIQGWSIIFGLPLVVISSVFIIYTYDDALNRHLDIHEHQKYHNEKTDEETNY